MLQIKQSEIDKAIKLCDEYEQFSVKSITLNGPGALNTKELKDAYRRGPSPFAIYISQIDERKLTELAALMYYGRDKSVSFDTFDQALEHCAEMPLSVRRSEIVSRSPVFCQYVQTGLQHLRDEGHSLRDRQSE